MAGHSKFKNIMHRKGAQDAKRSQLFAKLAREIYVAAKLGGTDASANPRLRSALLEARRNSMPKDNVERAINKAAADGGSEEYEEIRYEGMGPGNVPVIVEALTDNRNRTASEIRARFNKHGGSLTPVHFNFEHVGVIVHCGGTAEQIFNAAVGAGAADVSSSGDEQHRIECAPDDLSSVRDVLEASLGELASVQLEWRALNAVTLGAEQAASLLKFIDALEDLDDVQRVFAGYTLSAEAEAALTVG